ncbi:MAG: hypothetical protein CML42_08355 [Rhodobacteraceae bacterium]|nr:hypothetical protein [Paracoccaceae bacterium]|tara:strand:- start:36924 stop:37853 length:930 start_codon:yes stop_codon:yes gene_type:complete
MYTGIFREKKGLTNIKRKPRKTRIKTRQIIHIPMINTINENKKIIKKEVKPKKNKTNNKKIHEDKLHNFQLPYINYDFSLKNTISNKQTINFLHVQKTGGRSLTQYIKMRRLPIFCNHYIENVNKPLDNLFFIIRDPITRYISGFTHMFFIVNMLTKHWSEDYGIKEQYKFFYKHFPTPNILAESITSKDLIKRELALKAFEYINCIKNGYNVWFEKIKLKDIKYILRFERLQTDINEIFCKRNNISPFHLSNYDTVGKKKWNKENLHMKYLSNIAISNLKKIYIKDYYFIDQMISIGLLDKSYKNLLI